MRIGRLAPTGMPTERSYQERIESANRARGAMTARTDRLQSRTVDDLRGEAMRPVERGFETALFMSRWLLAPFLIGLVLTILMLIFRFFADFYDLAVRLPT